MGLSDFPPRPARTLAGRQFAPGLPSARGGISRVDARFLCPHPLTHTPVPPTGALDARLPVGRRPSPFSHRLGGHIARFEACSVFMFIRVCVLTDPAAAGPFWPRGFDPGRYRPEPLRVFPAGASVAGWDILLPLDQRALSTAHAKPGLTPTRRQAWMSRRRYAIISA
jgi:hypothetical protein